MNKDLPSFCGQPLKAAQLDLIRDCVSSYPGLSREELAATLCEWMAWCRPNGRLKTRECRDLLQQLQNQGLISLPALRAGRPRGTTTTIAHTTQEESHAPAQETLAALQPIRLRRVEQPDERRQWRELIDRYHYLGHRTAFGASVRYLIETPHRQPETLGCLQFSSAAWRMKARDHWIGWDEDGRKANLPRLINNSRFLILPWIQIPNLASHVLALALRTVTQDWERQYGLRPWLVETLVDIQHYSGHCYRAANWLDVGLTTGRGRQDRHHLRHGASPKRILLYPLRADACQMLCKKS